MPRCEQAAIAIAQVKTWRIGAAGSIVCDCQPECPEHDDDNEKFYGGHFVGESIHPLVAEFIVAACNAYRPAP